MSSFDLSDREERYCEWLATPKGQRQPATLAALADELEVHVSQLYRWRKRTNVRERVMDLVDDNVGGFERVQDVLNKMYENAMQDNQSSVKDRENFLRYAGVLVERRQVTTVETSEAADRSDQEILDELAQLRSRKGQ